MRKKDKRKKASEVFRETDYFFVKKSSFEETFPQIEEIEVRVTENGEGVSKGIETRIFHDGKHLGEFVDCSNSLCYNGGVSVGRIINSMVNDQITKYSNGHICQGNEGSPKGHRIYRKCLNFFKVEINIFYKDIQNTK